MSLTVHLFIVSCGLGLLAILVLVQAEIDRRRDAAAYAVALGELKRSREEYAATQEALRVSREHQDALLNNIPDIAFLKDRHSRFLAVNTTLAKAWNVTPAEMIGKSDLDFIPREIAERYRADDIRTLMTGEQIVVEEPLYMPDGSRVWIETIKTPYRNASGEFAGIVGIARDVTERHHTANALVKQTEILQSVMDNMDEAVLVVDEHQQYLVSNPAAELLLKHLLPPRGGLLASEDGLFFPDTITRIPWEASPVARASHGERIDDMEVVVHLGKSAEKRSFIISGRPVYDPNANLLGGVVICRDVTQKRLLERQLLQVQKLEAIGQLAAGIAHEINTPAQYVGDNVRFLENSFSRVLHALDAHSRLREHVTLHDMAPDMIAAKVAAVDATLTHGDIDYLRDEIPKAIQEAMEGIGRITEIVTAVRGFSHPGASRMISVDLNTQIEHTVAVSRSEWKYVADMVLELDPLLPPVMCIAGEVNQVILNLVVNAAHAIDDAGSKRGTITVSTRRIGDSVEIRVQDTGGGIPLEIRDRIFNPFFTTKEVGRGTGQGLAMAHAVIVDKHRGTITFDTEMGRGTAFTLLLPLRPATPMEAAA